MPIVSLRFAFAQAFAHHQPARFGKKPLIATEGSPV